MTSPLRRQLNDFRVARVNAYSGLETSLGQTLSAMYNMDTETPLATDAFSRMKADTNKFTEEQRELQLKRDLERFKEISDIRGQLQSGVMDPNEKQKAYDRLEEIQREGDDEFASMLEQSIDEGRLLSQESLNEIYKDYGLEFDRPMTKEEASILAEARKAELMRQAIIAHGPQGVIPGTLKFGASMLGVATDPIGLASMFIPVVGASRGARIIQKMGAVRGRMAIGAIEGGVGTLATEPLFYGLSKHAQLDYSMTEALFNIGAGFGLGTGIGAIAGVLGRGRTPRAATRDGVRSAADTGAAIVAPARAADTPTARPADATRVSGDTTRVTNTIPQSVNRDASATATRQFLNDDPINVSRFFDGTDLRGTTAIGRVGGYEFQSSRIADQIDVQRPSITYVVADENGILRFNTRKVAEAMAEQVDGWVQKQGRSWVVTKSAQGEVLRKPSGEVASFRTKSQAEQVVKPLVEQGENVKVIQRGDEADWVITKDMSDEDIESITNTGGIFEAEKGHSSENLSVRPEGQPKAKPLTGVEAEKEIAAKIVKDSEKARQTSDEAGYAREVSEEVELEFNEKALMDEIEELEGSLRSNELFDDGVMREQLSKETLLDLDTIGEMEKQHDDWKKAIEAAIDCIGFKP